MEEIEKTLKTNIYLLYTLTDTHVHAHTHSTIINMCPQTCEYRYMNAHIAHIHIK